MSNNVLITGASGFLGSALVPEFRPMADVVGVGHAHRQADQLQVDLRCREAVVQLLETVQPVAVVHAAAYRDPDFCEGQPAESARLNVESTRYLVEGLPENVPLVYIGSDYVFDGRQPPYTEESERNPVNVYGEQKVASEDVVLQRPLSAVLRIPVLIGQDLPGKPGFISKMLETIRDNQQEVVLDDVLMRFPTWIGDVAAAARFLIEARAEGVFHGSAAHGGTRYALNREMADFLGASFEHVQPSREVVLRGARRPADSQLGTGKLLDVGFPGFRPLVEVLELLDL